MPLSKQDANTQPLISTLLGLLKDIRRADAECDRLARKLRVVRGHGRAFAIEATERRITAAQRRLNELQAAVRTKAPMMFSTAQCELPAGETVVRRRPSTGALITLHGGQHHGRCRLTIEGVGLTEPLDVRCGSESVNLVGFLLAEVLGGTMCCDHEADNAWAQFKAKMRAKSDRPIDDGGQV